MTEAQEKDFTVRINHLYMWWFTRSAVAFNKSFGQYALDELKDVLTTASTGQPDKPSAS